MADQFLTLLDATRLSDKRGVATGIVETVETWHPEVDVVLGEPITGVNYSSLVRVTRAGSPTFRAANEGTDTVASSYSEKTFGCFFCDAQLQIDEAILKKADQNPNMGRPKLKTMEVNGVVMSKMENFGKQFYTGRAIDANGFPGLRDFLDTTNMVVDATGSGSLATYTAYFVWNNPMGVEFIFGNNEGLVWNDWQLQQVQDAANKKFMAEVANLSGYIGLACMHPKAVGVIKNITSAKPLTDKLAAELMTKFPIGLKPNLCFISRNSAFYLQTSRSLTSITNRGRADAGGLDVFAQEPTEIAGAKVVVTDSIALETNW